MQSRAQVCALTALLLTLAAPAAGAQGLRGLTFSIGRFDVARDERPTEAGLEYRFRPVKLWSVPFKPGVGVTVTEDDSYWVYANVGYDFELGRRWVVTPALGAGIYDPSDEGKDLGGPVEFRSSLEIAYRLRDKDGPQGGGPRIGLIFYHLSNAVLYENNPGSNSLALTFSLGR